MKKKGNKQKKNYRLLISIVVSAIALSLLGWAETGHAYASYDFSPAKTPVIAVIMQGIHDGVYPWDDLTGKLTGRDAGTDGNGSDTGTVDAGADNTPGDSYDTAGALNEDGAGNAAASGSDTDIIASDNNGIDNATGKNSASASGDGANNEAGGSIGKDGDTVVGNGANDTAGSSSGDSAAGSQVTGSGNSTGNSAGNATGNDVTGSTGNDAGNAAADGSGTDAVTSNGTERTSNGTGSGNAASDNANNDNTPRSFKSVDDDYFSDALFVGDSRMVGLSQYCEPLDTRADFYVKKALTIYNLKDGKAIKSFDGTTKTLWEVLDAKHYSKIYIMVGINEIGTGNSEYFRDAYKEVVDRIRETQPNAIIFINSIMHVSGNKDANDSLYNNTNINARNEAIASLADNIHIFYLNINEAVDDENGNLRQDITFDDIHLKGSCYEPWHEYLLSHGI